MENLTVKWNGTKGREYPYTVYSIDVNFKADQQGNYIFCREMSNGGWEAVYIGEGLLNERISEHRKTGCVTRKGATHIHAHLNTKEKAFNEETDLLLVHAKAYEPKGCNIKKGG